MSHRLSPGKFEFSARKLAQEQLFILSRAVQQSPNAIMIARAEGVIEYVNPSFTRLTGYTLDEVVAGEADVSFGEMMSGQYDGLWGVLREGRDWRGEVMGRRKNGETFWALESITPIHSPEGRITHLLVIRQDITQQKKDQKALQESEERFRQVAEMTGEWLWEQDPEGFYIYCSAAVQDILGYSPAEMIGKRYLDFRDEDEKARDLAALPGLIEMGNGFCRLLNCYINKAGHRVYTESTGAPLYDSSGCLVKWRGVDHDITARKRYEDELRLRNRAIEAANVGIGIMDASALSFPVIYANRALCSITGYEVSELVGSNLSILQGPDTDRLAFKKIINALDNGRSCEVTLKSYRKNGSMFWNQLLISPVKDELGRLTHFIAIQTDVTEKRRAEEQRHELEFARQIQLSLFPKAPLQLPGAQVFGFCVPANHVGGDYFDYFLMREYLDIVVADVAGHSVGSALIMAEARSSLKAEARRPNNGVDHGPGQALAELNDLLFEDLNRAETFISMFYMRYNPQTRQLRFASAGHNPPLLLREGARVCEPLDTEGMILGVVREVVFEEAALALAMGDRLLLYTDGIVEAQNEFGEFYGTRRLCQLFVDCRDGTPQEVVEEILADLHAFLAETPCSDDVTLVVAQIT